MRKIPTTLAALAMASALMLGAAGCSSDDNASDTTNTPEQAATMTSTEYATDSTATTVQSEVATTYSDAMTVDYDEDDLDATWSTSAASFITLADDSIRLTAPAAPPATGR